MQRSKLFPNNGGGGGKHITLPPGRHDDDYSLFGSLLAGLESDREGRGLVASTPTTSRRAIILIDEGKKTDCIYACLVDDRNRSWRHHGMQINWASTQFTQIVFFLFRLLDSRSR